MKKVAIILGTRPEAIKLIPVYFVLKKSDFFNVTLVSTGQHREMLDQIFSFFAVSPDIDLRIMREDQSLIDLTATLLKELGNLVNTLDPDLLLVQGDTTTAMVASLAGFYNKIKVGHVEAGLRTYDRYSPYPEEVNRRIIAQTSDYHFAPTENAASALKEEKINNVFTVGNTVIDSVLMAKEKVEKSIENYESVFPFLNENKKLILITGHRRESFGSTFTQICEAIAELSHNYPELTLVYPVHLNPNVQKPVFSLLGKLSNVYLIDPVPYDQMVFLLSKSYIILTDSGGIQEEAPSFNVPVLVMRDKTERPEGIKAGCTLLCGTAKERIIESFKSVYNNKNRWSQMSEAENPYGDGTSATQIAQILKNL